MSDELFSLSGDMPVATQAAPRQSYDRMIVEEVWDSATPIAGNDAGLWRRDEHGATICRSEYGNRMSSYGWEIIETSSGSYQLGTPGTLKATHVENL